MINTGYRVTIKRASHNQANGRANYIVVRCQQGVFTEHKKIWPNPYEKGHYVLNLPSPKKPGTFINPKSVLNANRAGRPR